MKKNKFYAVVFSLLLISYNSFFDFKPLLEFSSQLITVIFFTLLVFTIGNFSYKKGFFIGPIKCVIFSLFIAIIPAVLFSDQNLTQSFIAIAPYSYFLLFLFLIDAKINRNTITKIILGFAYIGLILFFFQFLFVETVFFGGKDEFLEDRGVIRILFPGEGFMFFALFYYLNKLGANFKIKYLIALIPFVLMMVMQVTRIYILAFGLIAIYHFMIKSQMKFRIATIIGFMICYSYFYNSENTIVKGIRNATENDVEQKEDNIRLLEAQYFLFNFSNNDITYVLGNGAYYYKSSYGKQISYLSTNQSFYLEDLGILKGYFLFGILFVIGYILIFIKSFTVKIPYDLLYLKYYIWMILILSFTTRANTNAGFGAVMVTVLYLFEFAYLEQNNLIKEKSKVQIKN